MQYRLVLASAALLACTFTAPPLASHEPYDLGAEVLASSAGAPSQADCAALQPYFAKGRPSSVPTKTIAACLVYLCANTSACGSPPQPQPPTPIGIGGSGAGGTSATGGSVSKGGSGGNSTKVDGLALCLAATKANPDRKVQAADNGMSITALANSLCAPAQVQVCYASGACK
jgi:hypothetical protein